METDMTEKTGLAAVHAAATDPVPSIEMPRADYDAALASATAAGHADGVKAGAAAERARIKTIVSSDKAKGRDQLAHSLAFNTELTAEQAIAVLGDAPEAQKASRLDAIVPQPKIDAQESAAAAPAAGLAAAVAKLVVKKYGPQTAV
jgi:hypothetical protein